MSIKRGYTLLLLALTLLLWGSCGEEENFADSEGEVKTEFSMVIPGQTAGQKSGRMLVGDVQADGTFRGITDLKLYPFETPGQQVESATQITTFNILANMVPVEKQASGAKSYWFKDLEIKVGTNAFLVYGKAKTPDGIDAAAAPFRYGSTVTTFDNINKTDPVSDLKFIPSPIQTRQFFYEEKHPAIKWAPSKYREIVQAQTADGGAAWWSTTQPALAQLYNGFVFGSSNGGVISASSRTLLAVYQSLYNQLNQVIFEENKKTEGKDAQALALAQAVQSSITAPYMAGNTTYEINANEIAAATSQQAAVHRLVYAEGRNPDYPLCINYPDGVVTLKVTPQENAPAMVAYNYDENLAEGNKGIWDTYVYPPELYYTANTPIGTSGQAQSDKLSAATPWNDFVSATNYPDNRVSPLTRSIVLKKPLQYGMANLQTKVKLKENLLEDYDPADGVKVDVSEGLLWTGLMIADQKEVGWNFTREVAGLKEDAFTVYDRELNGAAVQPNGAKGLLVKTAASLPEPATNYTLVYPTKRVEYEISASNTDRVHVVLEFENGDTDFHGAAGTLIPAHTRFYIPALLDLSKLGLDATRDRRQIFESDYTTKVTFVVNDLRNANNSVPDLRTVKSELGVSVYITWEPGMDFGEVEIK